MSGTHEVATTPVKLEAVHDFVGNQSVVWDQWNEAE